MFNALLISQMRNNFKTIRRPTAFTFIGEVHLEVTKLIFNNFQKIIETMEVVKNSRELCGEYKVEGNGCLHTLQTMEFRFCLMLMKTILGMIEPADKQFQARETSLGDSMDVVQATLSALEEFRTSSNTFEEVGNIVKCKLSVEPETTQPQRTRKVSRKLRDFVITEYICETSDPEVDKNLIGSLKIIFTSTLDILLSEFKRRFTNNMELLAAISNLDNFCDLDFDNLKYFKSLGIKLPTPEQIVVVKNYIKEKKIEKKEIFNEMCKQKTAFSDTYNLLAFVRAFGCSTAICESTFSVLTRTMSQRRMSNLVLLGFEQRRTMNLDLTKVLHKFNNSKNRRLQLF